MLKTMDQDLARQLIEQTPDVLTEAIKEEEARYKNMACPMCHHRGCAKIPKVPRLVDTPNGPVLDTGFSNAPLPAGDARCGECGTTFDPDSGIIHSTEASLIPGPQ